MCIWPSANTRLQPTGGRRGLWLRCARCRLCPGGRLAEDGEEGICSSASGHLPTVGYSGLGEYRSRIWYVSSNT